MSAPRFDVVIPTVGRPSLAVLLEALAEGDGPMPDSVAVVDDRRDRGALPGVPPPPPLSDRLRVLTGRSAGPAAARNVGWRPGLAPWVVFLDDDVIPDPGWRALLGEDLASAGAAVAGVQGRVRVPVPTDRPLTDWERNTRGLESARWATADMAYRRSALVEAGGFDERFPRAYREDADLALRVIGAGHRLVRGRRTVLHPVRPADPWISIRLQAGNRDDVLMRALHGPRWREAAGAPRGRLRRHVATALAAAVAVAGLAGRQRRVASAAGLLWAAGIAELAWARIRPGPRAPDEVRRMVLTSALLPVAAAYHAAAGRLRLPGLLARPGPRRGPAAVLLDRDGTLVVDVPYNGDPQRVTPVPGVREALDRLRAAGLRTAVVSNQSAVGRGLITEDQLRAVNRRIEELLGPLGPWEVCLHDPAAACPCRKPAPGLVRAAAAHLGVSPDRCVVIGDTGADVDAALAAGARAILVPTRVTRAGEVAEAPAVARDLGEAVDLLLEGRP